MQRKSCVLLFNSGQSIETTSQYNVLLKTEELLYWLRCPSSFWLNTWSRWSAVAGNSKNFCFVAKNNEIFLVSTGAWKCVTADTATTIELEFFARLS